MNKSKAVFPTQKNALQSQFRHGFVAAITGFAYWWSFSLLSSVQEPWDGQYYWAAAYPIALLISAALGFALRRDALVIGLSYTLAQLPVMILNTGFETSLGTAALFLGLLSVPSVLAAKLGTSLSVSAVQQSDADEPANDH